jgi:formylglycine-generating enzyme
MHLAPAAFAAVVALGGGLLGGLARAGEPRGKVIQIDHRSREVMVPAGAFSMGVPDDELEVAVGLCEMFFEPTEQLALLRAQGRMGSFCTSYRDELAQMAPRQVFLRAFAIDRDEVTTADYRACIAAGMCSLEPLIAGDERYIRDEWPLVNVTWFEAQEYCRWRGGRLPTEAEWERAARGDASGPWPWCWEAGTCVERPADFNHGQPRAQAMRDVDRSAHHLHLIGEPDDSDGTAQLAPPGRYPWSQGPYGTRDQAGNVAEWTADARGVDEATAGYRELPGCAEHDDTITCINPVREGGVGDARVVRGGSWRQPSFLGRANLRDPYNLVYEARRRFSHIGFRCARTLP